MTNHELTNNESQTDMKTIQQLWIYTLLLILPLGVLAQDERDNRGDKYYKDLGYGSAIPEYKSTVGEAGRLDRKTMIRLANSYRLIGDYQNAELYYAQIVESSSKPLYRLYYAQALQANGKCEAAKKYFLEYDQLIRTDIADGSGTDEDRRGRILANACDTEFSTNEDLVLQNERALNTASLDFSPAYYKNGLVFVSTRGLSRATQNEDAWLNSKFMDLFYSESVREEGREGSTLSAPKALPNVINSKFHEGPLTFDKPGNTMYFSRNNYSKGKRRFSRKKITKLKIYGADWDGEEWGNVWELPFNNDDDSHCHPTLSADGRYMYLSSDRAGGYGGHDLYVSTFQNGEWTTPMNLGARINTAGNELFPFMHEDGTLFFASNGHAGLGGLDVFMAKPDAAIGEAEAQMMWSVPVNLGEPLNSLKDDFGLIVDITGRSGYISSSREGGLGGDDIYSFKGTLDGTPPKEKQITSSTAPPRGTLLIAGTVINKLYNKSVPNATVYLTNKCTGETAAKLTDVNGGFSFAGECGCEYTLKGEKAGIGSATAYPSTLNVDCSQDIQTRLLIGGEVVSSSPSISSTPTRIITATPAPAPTRIISRTPVVTTPAPPPPTVYRPATTTFSASTTTYTVGDVIELEHIYYDFDKANIRSDASIDLDKLADVLRRYPGMSIELSSHTDSRATDVYNQALSQRRAQAAVNYLVARGIAPQRLTARGYGESQLRNNCPDGTPCSEAQHQRNRRTEFRVLSTEPNVDVRYIDNEPEYIDLPGNR